MSVGFTHPDGLINTDRIREGMAIIRRFNQPKSQHVVHISFELMDRILDELDELRSVAHRE